MIKAVIFDLWDTIIPSTIDFDYAARLLRQDHLSRSEFVSRYEHAVQLKRYKKFSELHRDFLAAFNKEPHELAEEELHEVYFKRTHSIRFFPEVREVLKELRKMGLLLGLLSNTENLLVGNIEKRTRLGAFFDSVCYSFDIGVLKPDRAAFLCILSKLGVKPGEALMVGDSLRNDIVGALGAGLHNCLINRSGRVFDYSKARPEFEIKSLKELVKVVGELDAKKVS